MSPSKKILFVIGSFFVGGAEKQLLLLAQELRKKNMSGQLVQEHGDMDISVFALSIQGSLYDDFKNLGVPIQSGYYDYQSSKIKRFFNLLCAPFRLFMWVRQQKPDVIQSFLPLTNFMAALVAIISRIPCITCWRSLTHYRKKHVGAHLLDKLSFYWSSLIVCNSQAVLKDICQHDAWIKASKLKVIYNGVFFSDHIMSPENIEIYRKKLGISPHDIAFVYVANLIPYKGHADLLKAFSLMQLFHEKTYKLFLIGEDRKGYLKTLENLAAQLKIQDRVFFLGHQDQVSPLLKCMDIGIMASHEEGFSNALLEKIAAGLPVVATDVGGNKEALSGINGCHIVPARDPVSLAGCLEKSAYLIDCSQKFQRSTQIKIKFSVKKMVDGYVDIYTKILKCRSIKIFSEIRNSKFFLIKILFGVGLLSYYFFVLFSPDQFINQLSWYPKWVYISAGVIFSLNLFVASFRLWLIYKYFCIPVFYRNVFSVFISGQVAGLVFFPFFTSMTVHALKLRNSVKSLDATVASYLIDRLIMTGSGVCLVLTSFCYLNKINLFSLSFWTEKELILRGIVLSIILITCTIKSRTYLKEIFSFRLLRYGSALILCSLSGWFLSAFIFTLFIMAAPNTASFSHVFTTALMVSFLSSIPISPNSVGIREFFAIQLFGLIGVSSSLAFSSAFIVGILSLVTLLIIYVFINQFKEKN